MCRLQTTEAIERPRAGQTGKSVIVAAADRLTEGYARRDPLPCGADGRSSLGRWRNTRAFSFSDGRNQAIVVPAAQGAFDRRGRFT
jgi:hypothetical protein